MPSITKRTPKQKDYDPFYQTSEWRNFRYVQMSLPQNATCRQCEKENKATIAFIADHILPRRFFPELEFTPSNIQGLCRTCDQKKRRLERGIMSREHAYVVLKDYLK